MAARGLGAGVVTTGSSDAGADVRFSGAEQAPRNFYRDYAAADGDQGAYYNSGGFSDFGDTDDIFTKPRDSRTEAYISGRIG